MKKIKLLLSVVLVAGLAACSPEIIEPVSEPVVANENVKVRIAGENDGLEDAKAPLIVVDGILVERDVLLEMAPEDIKSVDVFKGGLATAIYGDKGKNGVIVITTKR